MGRRLDRHLDTDLIERMELGWKPSKKTRTKRRTKTARSGASYRASRRNAALRAAVKGTWQGPETARQTYIARPPICRFNWALVDIGKSPLLSIRHRKQPKSYPYSSTRQNTRRASRSIA